MTVFAIMGHKELEILGAKIGSVYEGQHYHLPPAAWFVYDTLTTQEVAAKLEVNQGKLGVQAAVVSITNYGGWGPTSLWEWIKSRVEKSSG